MKGRIITLITLLAWIFNACDKDDISSEQQDSFIKFFSNYNELTGVDVKEVNGKGYAILGTANTYDNGTQICLIRTDEFGNSTDTVSFYGRSGDDQAYCLQVMPDGGFAILGSSENPSSGKKEVLFIKTDEKGVIQWSRTFSEPHDVEALHFVRDESSGLFYLIGYVLRESAPEVYNKDIWYHCLQANGSNEWLNPRTYPGVNDDVGTCIQVLNNDELILSGKTKTYPFPSVLDHAFVCKANSDGIVYTSIYTLGYFTEESAQIQVDGSDNIYMTGSITETDENTNDRDILLAKMKYNGDNLELSWVKSFIQTGRDYGTSLVITDNSVTILGTTTRGSSNTSIVLITTDQNGESPVYHYYGGGVQMTSSKLSKTSDNGLIITGSNEFTTDYSTAVLIKTGASAGL